MKKLIATVITIVLSLLAVVGLTACDGGFNATTMKDWGEIDYTSNGGMIAETENYIYFINGLAESTDDNTFGKPLKGSLMVADKSTVGTDQLKTEVVVPKLFVASDYNAGIYIFGAGDNAYVYYGTPSVEKDSSGNVANSYITFMRTKLDGTGSESFFTINGLDTDYRIGEKDGVVYIVYFDSDEVALKSFNTSTKQTTIIAKQDAKTRKGFALTENGETYYLSLNQYRFAENGTDLAVMFNMTVYAEDYYAQKEQDTENYVRAEAKFNVMYAYYFGDTLDKFEVGGKMIANGEQAQITHDFVLVEDGYLFFSETDINGKKKTYASMFSDIENKTLIDLPDNVIELSIIESLNTTYYKYVPDGEDVKGFIYKSTLVGDDVAVREEVIEESNVSSLLFIYKDYVYYYSSETKLARCKLEVGAKEEIISEDVVSSTWYNPEIIEINGKEYIFYLDSSTAGSNYIKYVDIANEAVEKETDDEITYMALEGQKLLGKMTDKDVANPAIVKINSIPTSEIEYTVKDDGTIEFKAYEEAKALYDALSDASKAEIKDSVLQRLNNAKEAQILANYYYKLNEWEDYNDKGETEQQAFKKTYEEAVDYRQSLINRVGKTTYESIRSMIDKDILYIYQETGKLFD